MKKYTILFMTLFLLTTCKNNDNPINDFEKNSSHDNELYVDSQTIMSGEIIYVPIYSSIFSSDSKKTTELTATMSIHKLIYKVQLK